MRKYDFTAIGLCGRSVFLSVDHFHAPEETLSAHNLFCEPGGKGYNQAVAGAKLGARVCFIGAVGDDSDADQCEMRLNQEGISKAVLIRKKEASTAFACILTNASGENRVTVYPGAAVMLTKQDVDAVQNEIADSEILLLTCELPEEAFERAVYIAHQNNTRIIINPAPYQPWVRKYLPLAQWITPNADEYARLFPNGDIQNAQGVLVTLGKSGAALKTNGQTTSFPAPEVHAIDTTGAGDAFNAAFACMLAHGKNVHDAAAFSVLAASESVKYAHVLDSYQFDSLKEKSR